MPNFRRAFVPGGSFFFTLVTHRRTRLFVLTLGYSRKAVRLLVFRSSSRVWAELHEKAFRRLGGVTRVVVLDNLREGVLTPDIYEPTLNPLYRDVLQHYGVTALPCRVQDPDRKGKVESGVGHAQKTPLKGQRFESLEDAQENMTLVISACDGQRRLLLVDISRCVPLEPEVRHFFTGEVLVQSFRALAMLVEASPFGRMMGNVYLRVARPGIPTKLFHDEQEALRWLRGHGA